MHAAIDYSNSNGNHAAIDYSNSKHAVIDYSTAITQP